MDPTPEEEVQRQLEELQKQYVCNLPGWIREIEAALLPDPETETMDPEILKQARRMLHDLAGNARTFGFSKVGEGAQILLERFHHLPDGVLFPFAHKNEIRDVIRKMGEAARMEPSGPIFFPQIRKSSAPLTAVREDFSRKIDFVVADAGFGQDISDWLDCFGFSVRVFPDLASMGKAMSDPPDAIILDFPMEEGDSPYPVAAFLRSIPENPPVIAISDKGDLRSRLFAVRVGAKAYLQKPLDVGSVVSTLDRLLPVWMEETIRVLIVDDASPLLVYHRTILAEAGMIVEILKEPLRVLETMDAFRPDVVLMDLYMPECTGQELTSLIRQTEKYHGVPIVFLSTETDLALQLEAMNPGGDGFLVKPILPDHLIESVRFRVKKSRFLESMRNRDSLTGLLTHSSILASAHEAVEEARRTGEPLSFALIDIDRFRELNGRFGHLVGDLVLRNLSRFILSRLGPGESIGRYGGETFLAVLPRSKEDTCVVRLDGIRKDFQRVRHHGSSHIEFQATFSAGISAFSPGASYGSMIDTADMALSRAKNDGRNRVIPASVQLPKPPKFP